jgi:nucleotide-binding universal stress UspA family protein
MYDRILLPTDGSDGAKAALEHAGNIAATYGSTLHVLTVVDTSNPHIGLIAEEVDEIDPGVVEETEGGTAGMVGGEHDIADELETRASSAVEGVAAQLPEDSKVVTAVEHGDPHETILDYAGDHDIDLIVMGTHGRTGLDRYLLGSVTEKVVRISDVPVMTVRFGDEV